MMVPNLNHRDPWFGKWLVQLQADTRVIYNTDQVRAVHSFHPWYFHRSDADCGANALGSAHTGNDDKQLRSHRAFLSAVTQPVHWE